MRQPRWHVAIPTTTGGGSIGDCQPAIPPMSVETSGTLLPHAFADLSQHVPNGVRKQSGSKGPATASMCGRNQGARRWSAPEWLRGTGTHLPPTSNLHTLTGWPRALDIDGYPTEWTLCSLKPARLSDRREVSMTIIIRRSLIPLRANELEEIVLGIFLRSWPARGPISTVPLTTVDS